jgi:hypothetical protein
MDSRGVGASERGLLVLFTSTLAACHADQWPDTSAHSESDATYATLLIHPVAIEMGIITIHKSVSHPFTRRMNTGSPWTDVQSVFIISVIARLSFSRPRLSILGRREGFL